MPGLLIIIIISLYTFLFSKRKQPMSTHTTVTRRYHFESAHWLPNVAIDHKCHRMHGHNYEVEITIAGPVMGTGFLIDFFDLDKIVEPLIRQIDHRTLNDVRGLENPTAELIAAWFMNRVNADLFPIPLHSVERVRVYETKDCFADVIRDVTVTV